MKILVTGSSGWLGRHLVPLLRAEGYTPIGFDVVPSEWTDIVSTVSDAGAVTKAFDEHNFGGVIHAAALHKPDISRYPQQAFIDVNITGTLNLLEAASVRPRIPFVFTSTTSLMINQSIRNEIGREAIWLDEDHAPIEPRNIYGATKLAAEALCRQHHIDKDLNAVILRTSRFFPEEDDTHRDLGGLNMKANEFLNRRATVGDMARAHIFALKKSSQIGFGLYLVSAPTPFSMVNCRQLKEDAESEIIKLFPDVKELYESNDWKLPTSIGRIYDGTRISRDLGFSYETNFASVLEAMRKGAPLPISHDATYVSPMVSRSL